MTNLLKLEEAAMVLLGLGAYWLLDLPWWLLLLLILTPDLSAIAYLAGPRVGAVFYNFFHHKGVAILAFLLGMYFSFFAGSDFIGTLSGILRLAGVIMFTHSSLDRVFGFGLKYPDSFQNTHLGTIGKKK